MMVPLSHVVVRPCWRILPSRFPPIHLFERVANSEDFDALYELEARTNPRLRDEIGDISLVPSQDRIFGPGSSFVMAAFTHPNPAGSRFSDGSYGVYYAAGELDTAIAETVHHRQNFMRATNQPRMELDMRVMIADLGSDLHDLRGRRGSYPEIYRLNDYAASQQLATKLRAQNSNGIAYDSVRRNPGQCFAMFRPTCLSNVRQERHLCYVWNGTEIEVIYEKRLYPS